LQIRENTEYLVDIVLPGDLDHAVEAAGGNRTWPLSPRLTKFYRSDPPRRWRSSALGVHITGVLNFGSYVGVADFGLPGGEPAMFEVVCSKIGYLEDFRTLLEEVAEECVALLFELGAPTFLPLSLQDAGNVPMSV
jgi:hypothetical protein